MQGHAERITFELDTFPQSSDQIQMNKVMSCFAKTSVPILILIMLFVGYNVASAQEKQMIARISEIEIDARHLEEYKAILKKEAEASVRLEPGVISIFPMNRKEPPTEIRILEIYASREAYESHLKTPHFQEYKTTTLQMVKSLKLVDMEAIDTETMAKIFKKMNKGE